MGWYDHCMEMLCTKLIDHGCCIFSVMQVADIPGEEHE